MPFIRIYYAVCMMRCTHTCTYSYTHSQLYAFHTPISGSACMMLSQPYAYTYYVHIHVLMHTHIRSCMPLIRIYRAQLVWCYHSHMHIHIMCIYTYLCIHIFAAVCLSYAYIGLSLYDAVRNFAVSSARFKLNGGKQALYPGEVCMYVCMYVCMCWWKHVQVPCLNWMAGSKPYILERYVCMYACMYVCADGSMFKCHV